MQNLHLLSLTILIIISLSSCKNSGQLTSQNDPRHSNALINESSPYLLQHAYNPVDWHPWNEETLAKAKRENKLLIISIGYAACHWCHVMEHESFEDEEVAALMNENFLPVKVDREERPDVDDVYMTACTLVSGRGGWPLNAFAMPDGRPIWAGTYFPKDKWTEILNQFIGLNKNNPEKLEDSAQRLTSGVNSVAIIEPVSPIAEFPLSEIDRVINLMNAQIDQKRGGRDGAPKFPMPNNYELLLKYGSLYDYNDALKSTFLTLDKMALGGIYDHVGGGFARYSVDADWKVPHFEKMLYDNGQLVGIYSMAYRHTKNDLYRNVVEQTLEFIDREMTAPNGGFYSSLDADSEGEEGKFYVWTEDELAEHLDPSLVATAKQYYSTSPAGNWEHSNILHITQDKKETAAALGITNIELENRVRSINTKLLKVRESRVRPGLDDKILTGWNALMISGYVEAYKAFQDASYLEKAVDNSEFLEKNLIHKDHRLLRNYTNDKNGINGFLDDYTATIKAMLDVYEITFDTKWIDLAKGLTEYTIQHFSNEENGMFYRASDIDPPLVAKSIETSDNVIPATNSMMARNLFRLGQMTYNEAYIERSKKMLSNMYQNIKDGSQPGFYSNWIQLWLDLAKSPYEIVISGPDLMKKSKELYNNYLGNSIVMGSLGENDKLPLLKYKYVKDKTMIYVCEDKVCQLPVEQIEDALKLMK